MAEKLVLPDGSALDADQVEQQFAKAMTTPQPDEPIAPAPEPRQPDPEPAAETKPDKPRRTTRSAAASSRRKPKASPAHVAEGTFVKPVQELLNGITLGTAVVPIPEGPMRVRMRLQGAMLEEHQDKLAGAVDLMAQNNATIRRGIEALTMGSAGWVLPCVIMVSPFAMNSAAIWKSKITPEMAAAADKFESDTLKDLAVLLGRAEQQVEAPQAA